MTVVHANTRLEAFCDGVFAIALTLLIIDIRLPSAEALGTTPEFWRALQHLLPSVFAFLLSFCIIFITWVNHHATLRLVHKSSASFIYANGFMLLTVVSIPFPTSLLGASVWTDHAAPAVVLYNAVLAVQAMSWIAVTGTALANHLVGDARSVAAIRQNRRNGYVACAFYAALAVSAIWLPLAIAIVTTVSWLFWLMLGIRMKHVPD